MRLFFSRCVFSILKNLFFKPTSVTYEHRDMQLKEKMERISFDFRLWKDFFFLKHNMKDPSSLKFCMHDYSWERATTRS